MSRAPYNPPKTHGTTIYPVHANGTSGLLKRVEPLITPKLLISRHLKGIFERLPAEFQYSNEELKDQINLAVNEAETILKMPIFAEEIREKHPFDRRLYDNYIHIKTQQGPIASLSQLAIVSSNGDNLYQIPAEWIETANFHKRQINVIPLLAAFGISSVQASTVSGGIVFLSTIAGLNWLPAYWEVIYQAGVCSEPGKVPMPVNQLIGTIAAMNILSPLALSNPHNSVSLSQDGIGQSTSGSGVQIFVNRMGELEAKKQELIGSLLRIFSNKYYVNNI